MARMKMKTGLTLGLAVAAITAVIGAGAAGADEAPYKIGISAGLTGYASTVDTAWTHGVQVAADALNAQGGIMGHKVEVIVEDNHSNPQDAVTAYRKMMSEGVKLFASGCVSAGNAAAAPMVSKAEIPMMLCSILPKDDKWAFTTLPSPAFEVETRYAYLKDHTQIRKVGVLHDPTPYAMFQAKVATAEAEKYGLQVVDEEAYRQDDADLSVQLSKIQAAGAGAVMKIGIGGSTLTAAKNLKQLGSPMLMLTSLEDVAVFGPVSQVLGDKFFFVAAPSQVYDAVPDGPLKTALGKFMTPWTAKYGKADPDWASRGWDAVMLAAKAVEDAKSTEGPKVRDAMEKIEGFQGTTGVYSFSADRHQGIATNPLLLARIADGKVEIVGK